MGRFATVEDDWIRRGECTDIYFVTTEEILRRSGRNPVIAMEVTAAELPMEWAVFCGLDDVLSLMEGIPVTIDAMDEGTIFFSGEPVLRIEGHYLDFARYETAILGFLCHASGIATAAASIRHISGGKKIYSFGSRRQHPAIATMVERAAWIGGVDGVSNTAAPPDVPLVGTMPHSFVMCYPSPEEAFAAFDRYAGPDIPRIFLCDTFCDEKKESLAGARSGAQGVRLDTPRSRRGNMRAILEEVRWELDAAGYPEVQIVLSGGVTRNDIIAYRDIVDAFGVGGRLPMPRWWTLPWISSLLTGCPVPSVAKRAGPSRYGKCRAAGMFFCRQNIPGLKEEPLLSHHLSGTAWSGNALPCLRPGIGSSDPCCSLKTQVPLHRAVGNSLNRQAPDK